MEKKESVVGELQLIKKQSGKSCSEIAAQTGLTNVYVAQLFRRQAQLKPETAKSLRLAVPGLNDDHIEAMKRPPLRSYDPNLLQDPCLYRLHEAVMHFGESIKEIINEDFGDGIGNAAYKNRGNKESNFKIFQQCLPGSWEAAFTWCLELAFMKDTWYLSQQLYTLLMICKLWTSMEMRIDDHPIVVDGL